MNSGSVPNLSFLVKVYALLATSPILFDGSFTAVGVDGFKEVFHLPKQVSTGVGVCIDLTRLVNVSYK